MTDLQTLLRPAIEATQDTDGTVLPTETAEHLAGVLYADGWRHVAGSAGDVIQERLRHLELGYTPEHDDEHGLAHLIEEAHYRLGHMGEVASPESVRHDLIAAGALVLAALDHLERNPS